MAKPPKNGDRKVVFITEVDYKNIKNLDVYLNALLLRGRFKLLA